MKTRQELIEERTKARLQCVFALNEIILALEWGSGKTRAEVIAEILANKEKLQILIKTSCQNF